MNGALEKDARTVDVPSRSIHQDVDVLLLLQATRRPELDKQVIWRLPDIEDTVQQLEHIQLVGILCAYARDV